MITVNGVIITETQLQAEVELHASADDPMMSAGHELVLRELLRQRAAELGLVSSDADPYDAVLQAEVRTPAADEESCRRYYERNPSKFHVGDLIEIDHILFQLTSGVAAPSLRARAGEVLADLQKAGAHKFPEFAAQYSNCPSAQDGGHLGQIARGDTVPEFEAAVFALPADTLIDRLIESRHGFHIVRTGRKEEGRAPPFGEVRPRIAAWLEAASRRRATNQYLQWLVGQAAIEGIAIQGADTPLVQ